MRNNRDIGTKLGQYFLQLRGLQHISEKEAKKQGLIQCSAVKNRKIWKNIPACAA